MLSHAQRFAIAHDNESMCVYIDTHRGESRPINRTAIDWFMLFALSFFSRYFLRQLSMKKTKKKEKIPTTLYEDYKYTPCSSMIERREKGVRCSSSFFSSSSLFASRHGRYRSTLCLPCLLFWWKPSINGAQRSCALPEGEIEVNKNDAIWNKNIESLAHEVCIAVTFSCVVILVLVWFCFVHSLTSGDRVQSSNENNGMFLDRRKLLQTWAPRTFDIQLAVEKEITQRPPLSPHLTTRLFRLHRARRKADEKHVAPLVFVFSRQSTAPWTWSPLWVNDLPCCCCCRNRRVICVCF